LHFLLKIIYPITSVPGIKVHGSTFVLGGPPGPVGISFINEIYFGIVLLDSFVSHGIALGSPIAITA
jgi:hypothetical protein